MTRICSHCSSEYAPNNGKQRFCSERCRRDFQTARRGKERAAEWERERLERVAELRAVKARREAQFRAFMAASK
jgi:hypothetical protein